MGTTRYDYDLNGNLTRTLLGTEFNGSGRRYGWNAFNQLDRVENFTITNRQTTYTTLETYSYDAEGERALRTANGQTTIYMGGLWEEVYGGTWRALYTFNGEVIGATTNQPGNFVYLLGDHLGSATWSYNLQGGELGGKEYAPWGEQRAALYNMLSEPHDYTGQLLDSTGLLYYHARYYDPVLGRFLSPDSVVPGAGALTLAPHDATAAELWQQKGGGPTNPQDLNRYAYALNNPVKNTDPTGHCIGPAAVLCLPMAATAAKAAFDAAVVAVGVYLVADGVQQIAATQAATQEPAGAAAPEAGQAQGADQEQTTGESVSRSGRGRNKLAPDPNADGDHSVYQRDPQTGEIIKYQTYKKNPQNPSGYDPVKRYDGRGKPHYNKQTGKYVDTPHVQGKDIPGGVRPPMPDEIPGGGPQ